MYRVFYANSPGLSALHICKIAFSRSSQFPRRVKFASLDWQREIIFNWSISRRRPLLKTSSNVIKRDAKIPQTFQLIWFEKSNFVCSETVHYSFVHWIDWKIASCSPHTVYRRIPPSWSNWTHIFCIQIALCLPGMESTWKDHVILLHVWLA